ncbi:hypothetical protein DUNSADRAFT_17520 [Dunaliella salina]|uniref:Cytochrome b5 heme-binding domain-containing protein n=1 Tax=Dunaliella salina TaxID=3046 RepID=A0ABQ7GZY6_DUNSA|nr:hypothetical protein DUNSADRAFT_17520 [Dunaliella salina]|eukprot:KAF5840173.1 hypothetical protein DUNSADRAFT_17520 [Dunaliella salina]
MEDALALNNSLLPKNKFALHDGDPKLPIYIAVRGYVFDVSRDREVFGKGGPLNECAGQEISRAIALGPPPTNNPPASVSGSGQQGNVIEDSRGNSERADGVQEGLRSRARRGQSQGGTQQLQQQQQQQQGSGDEAPPLRITLRQCEIGKSKLHDCNDAQLVKVEEVLRMCREKYTQVGKLPEELHIDPLPILGDKYAGPCLIMLVVFFSVLLLGGLFFAFAPLAGWGNDWFVGKGLQPGSVLNRSKLNKIITHEQFLPNEDYE